MALTAQQLVDIRYYMGYSVTGSLAFQPYQELVYSNVSYYGISLDTRLANLSPEEEVRLTSYFLLNLPLREAEIQAAQDNLDTDSLTCGLPGKGGWTHNKQEVSDRRELFSRLRLDLCSFLGFAPGSGLLQTTRLVRA
jgi:hypothetical protein